MTQKVFLITTGGTIAMEQRRQAGGAVPALDGDKLLQNVPDWPGEIEVIEHCRLPSAHFTLENLWSLRQRVQDLARRPETGGIVITHGTDVMEESAYLLDLTVEGDPPIVLTGAMRTVSMAGYEGGANIEAALRVATAEQARGIGAVVVMEEEIHAARRVTKMHTLSPRAFQSPFWGPLGRVEGDRVILQKPPGRQILRTERLEERVLLIKQAVGMGDDLLRYAVEWGRRGVVLEVLGGGRVPPWWLPTIEEAIARGVVLVVTSRCPTGRLYDLYGYAGANRDLREAGAIFADGVNGPKARIKLMAALGAGLEGEALRQAFQRRP